MTMRENGKTREMPLEFARRGHLSHDKRLAHDRAARAGCAVLRSKRRNAKIGRINVDSSPTFAIPCREPLNRPAFRAMQYVNDLVALGFTPDSDRCSGRLR